MVQMIHNANKVYLVTNVKQCNCQLVRNFIISTAENY